MNWPNATKESEYGDTIKYQKDYKDYLVVPNPLRSSYEGINIVFKKKTEFSLIIVIFFNAEFGNSGDDIGEIVFQNGKKYIYQR